MKGHVCGCKEVATASCRAATAAACMADRDGVTEALIAGVAALLPVGVSRSASSMRCCRVPERLLLRLHIGEHRRRPAKGTRFIAHRNPPIYRISAALYMMKLTITDGPLLTPV